MARREEGPYRSADVREGVALPRRDRWFPHWTGLIAIVTAAGAAIILWTAQRTAVGAPIVGFLSVAWLVVLAVIVRSVAIGRSRPLGLLFGMAMFPMVVATIYGVVYVSPERLAHATNAPWHAAALLRSVRSVELAASTLSALAWGLVAIAGTGFVLTIDPRVGQGSRPERAMLRAIPSAAFFLFAIGFAIVRVHGAHRHGLGGALPAAVVGLTSAIGLVLLGRCARIAKWHDDRERSTIQWSAWFAVVALMFAALSCEWVVLGQDELRALTVLTDRQTTFDGRLEHVQALDGAERVHPGALVALALAGGTFLVGLLFAMLPSPKLPRMIRVLASAGGVFLAAIFMISAELGPHFEAAPLVDGARVELPAAPGLPPRPAGDPLPVVLRAGEKTPSLPQGTDLREVQASTEPMLLVADRRLGAFALLDTARDLGATQRWTALLVEGAPPRLTEGLGRSRGLLGPVRSALEFSLPQKERPDEPGGSLRRWDDVLLVIDDQGVGRVVRRRAGPGRFVFGKVVGINFQRDPEATAHRRRVGEEMRAPLILLGVHPQSDVQGLSDAMVAAHDLSPRAILLVTKDREELESAFAAPPTSAY